MMVGMPDYVRKLIDKIVPWIEFDIEKSDFHLRADAPKEIIDAQKRLDNYTKKHSNPFGFVE